MKCQSPHAVLIAGCVLALAGCSPVNTTGDVSVADPGGLDRAVFGSYWEPGRLPDLGQVQRVAIAEFTIEFVTERVLRISDAPETSKRVTDWGKSLKRQLPDRLYAKIVERMEARGKAVTPRDAVSRTPALGRYAVPTGAGMPVVRHNPPAASSTGKIIVTELRAAPGLPVLADPANAQAVEIDRALAAELGVDTIVRARYRVGVYHGRATVEDGSIVTITTPTESVTLRSKRTLASEFSVQQNYGYQPNVNGEYRVSERVYLGAIDDLFVAYAGLAFEAMK